MPKEFAEKWLQELRSGKYKQGIEQLAKKLDFEDYEFCCLGVACMINQKDVKLLESGFIDNNILINAVSVPEEITGSENDLVNALTKMNDCGTSFLDIANWIEENVEFYN